MDKPMHQELQNLEHAFIQMKRRMDAEWAKRGDFPINAMQARILVRIFEDGPQKASTLAEQLYLTAGAITGIADKLIQLEYVERVRDLEDRRVVYLVLTDKGRGLLEKLKVQRAEISDMMFSGLSQEEIRELTRLFNRIIANLDSE